MDSINYRTNIYGIIHKRRQYQRWKQKPKPYYDVSLRNSYIYFCVHKSSFLTLFNENFKQNFKVSTTENTFTQAKSSQQSSKYAGAFIRNKYVDTVWKLRKFTLINLKQKFREINGICTISHCMPFS